MGIFDLFNKTNTVPKQTTISKQKILVVEDELYLREFYQDLLTQSGYEVIAAIDGQEALSYISSNVPDLIILDLMMPKIDGFGVLEKLSSDNKTKKIPVIILTNAGNIPNMDKAQYFSTYKFFIKSNITPEELLAAIKAALPTNQ